MIFLFVCSYSYHYSSTCVTTYCSPDSGHCMANTVQSGVTSLCRAVFTCITTFMTSPVHVICTVTVNKLWLPSSSILRLFSTGAWPEVLATTNYSCLIVVVQPMWRVSTTSHNKRRGSKRRTKQNERGRPAALYDDNNAPSVALARKGQ
jgi:hypothetical protein